MLASFCAWAATESPACIVPLTIPGGNPVTAVPGLTPRLPLTVVGPVFVTALPPSTPKLPAVPRGGRIAPARTDMGTVDMNARVPSNVMTTSVAALCRVVRAILFRPFDV